MLKWFTENHLDELLTAGATKRVENEKADLTKVKKLIT